MSQYVARSMGTPPSVMVETSGMSGERFAVLLLDIGLERFPLDVLARKLEGVSRDLIDGPRGFVRIRTLDTSKYSDDDLTMLYWGIGTHLGEPWPQNKYGHVMGDVTDQGRRPDDP